MRRSLSLLAVAAVLAAPAAFAQSAPAQNSDPVLATVNGMAIHMSDLQAAAQNLPAQAQQMPQDQLFNALLNQEIDRKALLVAAQKENLASNPDVAAAMQDAANTRLENAYVQEHVAPAVSDTAVQAEYNRSYAGKPGPAQVDARHILVQSEDQAKDIIKQLDHGADFATLAKKYSIDPGAKDGGELGWFSQDEMVPAFANAAFALSTGKYTETPVQTQFGWHVILCEGKRTGPTPALADVADQIKQKLENAAIQQTLDAARAQVKIVVNQPPASAPGTGAGN
jgi:peptidyl-prolyl cis-trans isomerase C